MNTESQIASSPVTELQILPVMREEALALVREGFAVLPVYEMRPDGSCACGRSGCSSRGKHPRLQHGVKDATLVEEVVLQWWSQWPNANIGIATGDLSGVFVLDVDVKHHGQDALELLMNRHGLLPDTRICQTGGGGFHVFFRLPSGRKIANSAKKVGQGIDVRGEGGYVVAAPSSHSSGGTYKWNNPECPIGPAPDWLVELCCEAKSRQPSDAVKKDGAAPDFLSEGRRNTDLTAVAGFLRAKGLAVEGIEAALASVNAQLTAPLPATEVASIARGIGRYAPHIKMDELFFTDVLVNAFGDRIRHCTTSGWTIYDGTVWRPDDSDKFVTEVAKRTVEEFAATLSRLRFFVRPITALPTT